jgi:hypothetical protein
MEELERTPAPRPNPHRRPTAGARADDAAARRSVRLREGRAPFLWMQLDERPLGLKCHPARRATMEAHRVGRGHDQ